MTKETERERRGEGPYRPRRGRGGGTVRSEKKVEGEEGDSTNFLLLLPLEGVEAQWEAEREELLPHNK